MIPRTVRLSEAPSYGQPITTFDPKSEGRLGLPAPGRGGGHPWRGVADWGGASVP